MFIVQATGVYTTKLFFFVIDVVYLGKNLHPSLIFVDKAKLIHKAG
jgi:hypothetical protein